jgi:hypothetical protein
MDKHFKGKCFCGTVEFEVVGDPEVMGYCHCEDCQAWSAAPINAMSLWRPESVEITAGSDHVVTFNKSENSFRKFCRTCGGHLMTDHPGMGLVDVYANIIDGFAHVPTVHVNYQNKMVSVNDGLPKFKDLPEDFGGSGELLPD